MREGEYLGDDEGGEPGNLPPAMDVGEAAIGEREFLSDSIKERSRFYQRFLHVLQVEMLSR